MNNHEGSASSVVDQAVAVAVDDTVALRDRDRHRVRAGLGRELAERAEHDAVHTVLDEVERVLDRGADRRAAGADFVDAAHRLHADDNCDTYGRDRQRHAERARGRREHRSQLQAHGREHLASEILTA